MAEESVADNVRTVALGWSWIKPGDISLMFQVPEIEGEVVKLPTRECIAMAFLVNQKPITRKQKKRLEQTAKSGEEIPDTLEVIELLQIDLENGWADSPVKNVVVDMLGTDVIGDLEKPHSVLELNLTVDEKMRSHWARAVEIARAYGKDCESKLTQAVLRMLLESREPVANKSAH